MGHGGSINPAHLGNLGVSKFVILDTYTLVMTNIIVENHHLFHGKIHYFDWVIFNSYVTNYQRETV